MITSRAKCPLTSNDGLTVDHRPGFSGQWHSHFVCPHVTNMPKMYLHTPHVHPDTPADTSHLSSNLLLFLVVA